MSLFDGIPLDNYDTPKAAPVVAPPFTITIKRISTGEEILLCSQDPAPAEAVAQAVKQKLPLFTLAEVSLMKEAASLSAVLLEQIITTKRTFPGSAITELLREAA